MERGRSVQLGKNGNGHLWLSGDVVLPAKASVVLLWELDLARPRDYFSQPSTSSLVGIHLSHNSVPPSNATKLTSRAFPSGPR